MADQKNSNGAAIGAGIAGAVVGAGVAVAATTILSDEKKREQVKNTLNNVKNKVVDSVNSLEEQKAKAAKDLSNKLKETKKASQNHATA